MARRLNPQANSAYGTPQGLIKMAPIPVESLRAPLASDLGYQIGQTWINKTTSLAYTLTNNSGGVATWNLTSSTVSDVNTVNGLGSVANDILIAGGTNITDVNAGHTVTLDLNDAISLATSVTSPIYTSTAAMAINAPLGSDITIMMGDAAGANKVSFTTSGGAEVFSINSLGTFGAFAGVTATGILTQTGGAVNLGMDNLGSAINIGGGNVIKAIAIGGGAAAHTIALGSAAAGAITADSAQGISLDAALASNFTVTGANRDLTLASVGGSVNVSASEAANDAIVINASDAAGGIQIKGGTGGVRIGDEADTSLLNLGNIAPTATRNINIGVGTVTTAAVTDTVNVGTGGATTNANSIKTVNVNTGGVTLGEVLTNIATGAVTSGTHTTEISTGARAAGTMAVNVLTGTGTKTLNIGNADALTTANIDAITLINDSTNAAVSICTGTSTGTVTIGNGLSGAIGVVGGAAVTVDAVGVLELNSSAAAIGIGSDANNFAVNIGTAGVRTVTVGSVTGASSTVIQGGTGGITFTGDIVQLNSDFITRTGDQITFQSSPIVQSVLGTGAAPTGATGDVNLVCCQEGIIMEEFVIGAGQTIIAPRMNANGLLVSGDLTATEGYEYNFGAARSNSRHAFTIGTSPAFMFELAFRIADMSGADPYVFGFRKVEANNAVFNDYTDYATMGMIAGTSATEIVLSTEKNSAGNTITNTTDLWGGDGTTKTLTVLVSSAGVVTYLVNGAAPTVTAAFTFDNADVVVPFIRITHAAVAPGAVELLSMKVGFQP